MSKIYLSMGDSSSDPVVVEVDTLGPRVTIRTGQQGEGRFEFPISTSNLRELGNLFIQASRNMEIQERNDAAAASSKYENRVSAAEKARDNYLPTIREANEICRSAFSIATRKGEDTNWDAFTAQLTKALDTQHKVMYPVKDHYVVS